MARYIFSKKKFTKFYGKEKTNCNREWIEEVKGKVFNSETDYFATQINGYGVIDDWCTKLDKVNYPKNF